MRLFDSTINYAFIYALFYTFIYAFIYTCMHAFTVFMHLCVIYAFIRLNMKWLIGHIKCLKNFLITVSINQFF